MYILHCFVSTLFAQVLVLVCRAERLRQRALMNIFIIIITSPKVTAFATTALCFSTSCNVLSTYHRISCTTQAGNLKYMDDNQGPVVQSVVSLTSSLRVISLTVLVDSIYNILIFLLKNVSSFFQQKHFSIFAYDSM